MVEMKLMTSDQVSEIQATLKELRDELTNKKTYQYTVYSQNDEEYTRKISEIEGRIKTLEADLSTLSTEIADLTKRINVNSDRLQELQAALEVARKHLKQLRATREADVLKYEDRVKSTNAILEAVKTIIDRLNGLLSGSVALTEVKKVLKSNDPLGMFVQLTATFTPEEIRAVLNKLSQIQVSLEQSLLDDADSEAKAKANFDVLEAEFVKTIADFEAEINGLTRSIEDDSTTRTNKQGEYDNKSAELTSKKGELSDYQHRKSTNESEFQAKNAKVLSEIDLVDQVITIFQNNENKFRGLLAKGGASF